MTFKKLLLCLLLVMSINLTSCKSLSIPVPSKADIALVMKDSHSRFVVADKTFAEVYKNLYNLYQQGFISDDDARKILKVREELDAVMHIWFYTLKTRDVEGLKKVAEDAEKLVKELKAWERSAEDDKKNNNKEDKGLDI